MSILITGGVKSGKSSLSLRLAEKWDATRYFLATAEAFDDEMREKIRIHQEERDPRFITIEEPLHIDRHVNDCLVLDCITLWMNNIFFREMTDRWGEILRNFLVSMGPNTIIVTNETGMGNIPVDPVSRQYNNALGAANKMIAGAVDEVYLMVAGIPLRAK